MEWVCLLISILPLCCSWCLLAQPHLARLPFRLLISHATSGNCWVQLLPAELLQSFPGISVPGILFPLVLVAPTTISLSWINAKPYLGGEKMQNLSCFKQFCRVLIHAGACGVHVLFCNTSALFEMQKLSLETYEPSFTFVFYCWFLIPGVFSFAVVFTLHSGFSLTKPSYPFELRTTCCLCPMLCHLVSPKEHGRTLSGHVNMNMAPAIILKRAEGWTSLTECSCSAGGKLVHKWVQWTGYREWRQEQELPSCLNCLWDQSCLFSAKQWAMNRRICATLSYFS